MIIFLIFILNLSTETFVKGKKIATLENELEDLRMNVINSENKEHWTQLSHKEGLKSLSLIVKQIDKNRDQILSIGELKRWLDKADRFLKITKVLHLWKLTNKNNAAEVSWHDYSTNRYGWIDVDYELETNYGQSNVRNDLRRWKLADYNGDNNLTLREFYTFVHPIHWQHDVIYSLEEVSHYDLNADSKVEYYEYLRYLFHGELENLEADEEKNFREQFDRHDVDKDGVLDLAEMRPMFQSCPNHATNRDKAVAIVNEWDRNKDGHLTIHELYGSYTEAGYSPLTGGGELLLRMEEFLQFKCDNCIA